MSLLPNNSFLQDQRFAELIDDASREDYSILKVDPMNCDERLLDNLAIGAGVDISGLSIEEARIYIHNAKEIKKYQGTVFAVEQSIKVCFADGKLKEWFEDDLDKGFFNVEVTLKANPELVYLPSKFEKAKHMINKSKNVRSKLGVFKIDFPQADENIEKSEAMNFHIDLSSKISMKDIDTDIDAFTGAKFKINLDSKMPLKDIDTNINTSTGAEFIFATNSQNNIQNIPVVCINKFIGGAMWQI